MRKTVLRLLTAILALIAIGCPSGRRESPNQHAQSTSAEKEVTPVREETWQIKGRNFFLRVEKLPPPPGTANPQYTLNIMGDAPMIQLTYPGEPYSLEVLPEKVLFSGHPFEVTDDPELFRIDGAESKLGPPSNRLFVFVSGKLVHVLSL